jgi:hypothetical protein
VIVEKTSTGFSAFCPDHPVFTSGRSVPDLLNNAVEAVNLFFEGKGIKISRADLQFEVDFKQFFQYYRVINARFLAEKIGMNPSLLSQYVQGRKKPSGAQTGKILAGIHAIGEELSEIELIYKL